MIDATAGSPDLATTLLGILRGGEPERMKADARAMIAAAAQFLADHLGADVVSAMLRADAETVGAFAKPPAIERPAGTALH